MLGTLSPNEVAQEVLARLFQRKLVPMIGAGCSAGPPSNLPTASALAQDLIDCGAGQPGQALEDIAEEAFARGDWQGFAQLLPIHEWRSRPANVIVRVLAELCKEGLISQIVTTNWDLLIESALNQIGQPFSKVVDAGSLATEPSADVTVVKLNGCIDHPQYFKATRTQIEAHDWQDAWADALFAVLVRQNSMLFAGYSGASRAATATIETIVRANERHGGDFVIDRATPEQIASASDSGKRFMEAIALTAAYTGDAPQFFAALRDEVYPKLLAAPAGLARRMSGELVGPTSVEPTAIADPIERITAAFVEAGAHGCQTWLREVFSAFSDVDHAKPYVPVRPNAEDIAKCVLLLAVLLWAGVLKSVGPNGMEVAVDVSGASTQLPCLIAIGPPGKRQDATARAALFRFAQQERRPPTAVGVGVIFGGIGRAEEATSTFSITRGGHQGSTARPNGASIAWIDADSLLAGFRADADEPAIHTSLLQQVSSAAEKALADAV